MTGKGHPIPLDDRLDPPCIDPGLPDDEALQAPVHTVNVWAPLLVSLLIHLGIGWWLLLPRDIVNPAAPLVAKAFVVRMVSTNPLAPDAPSVDPVETTAPDTLVSPAESVSLPSTPIVEVPAVSDPAPSPDTPVIQTPSTLSLRQVVEETASRQEQQNSGFHCSPLQLENERLDCSNRIDERFENVPNNAIVEFFSRDEAPGRLENAARMTTAGSEQIRMNLRAAGISDVYIDQLMNQLQSLAKEYAAPENEKTEILRDEMLRNDPVWQQRERAMNPR